jgi:hypothetical protein
MWDFILVPPKSKPELDCDKLYFAALLHALCCRDSRLVLRPVESFFECRDGSFDLFLRLVVPKHRLAGASNDEF